ATALVDAENWISHTEKIFDVMGCEDAFKTRLAVYKFEGNALAWWKAYKQAKGGDAWLITVTWTEFKKLSSCWYRGGAGQELSIGSSQSRGPSEGYSYPVCTTCGRRHPGECRRAAGTCFRYGQAGHLQKDFKKNTTASTSGQANKKPGASGCVFAITEGHAANTSEKSKHNVNFHLIVDFVEASPLRIETKEEGTKILATVDGILRTVTESSLRTNLKLKDEEGISSLSDAKLFENLTLMGYNISPNQKFTFQKGQFSHQWKYLIHTIMQCLNPKSTGFNEFSSNISTALVCLATNRVYNFSKMIFDGMVKNVNNKVSKFFMYPRRARIAQSSALPPVVDEHASPLRDVSQGKACLTISSIDAEQDRANIAKTSTLPYDLQRQQSDLVSNFEAQEVKITMLKARVKLLEDGEGRDAERSGNDAPIKGRRLDEGDEAAKKGSNNTEEMINVLTSIDATTVLLSGVAKVPTGSGSIPIVGPPAAEVPTGSDVVPTFDSETPKKKKIQEQMDIQMARQLEEEMEREAQRMNEQIARDAEIARIHAEEKLQIMIDGLDRSNETVAKYLQEYHQFATELHIERRIELISDLVRYQDNYAKVHKYQTLQRKPRSKKQKKDYYMEVIKDHAGWKTKDFKGISFEQIEAKINTVWKQIEDFIPIGSKEETERFKRKGFRLEQVSKKKLKTSEEVPKEVKATEEVLKDKVKEMMQLVPVEEIYVEALQVK
nr:zinc finger, CCHC-type, retrotransposon Gag domain protein [Tanacetum cinerariifolium]